MAEEMRGEMDRRVALERERAAAGAEAGGSSEQALHRRCMDLLILPSAFVRAFTLKVSRALISVECLL
jgi:hypothetical protein